MSFLFVFVDSKSSVINVFLLSFIIVSLLLIGLVYGQSTCGGNCPSGACTACPCGYSANYADQGTVQGKKFCTWVQQLRKTTGYFSQFGLNVGVFTCIANSESSFNAAAMNQNGNTDMVVCISW